VRDEALRGSLAARYQPVPVCSLQAPDELTVPSYYPGTSTFLNATRLDLAISQELSGLVLPLVAAETVPLSGRTSPHNVSFSETVAMLIEAGVCRAMTPLDARGQFSFGRVPPGRYQVEVRAFGPPTMDEKTYFEVASRRSGPAFWASITADVPEKTPTVLDVPLTTGPLVAGHVMTDDGQWSKALLTPLQMQNPYLRLDAQLADGAPIFSLYAAVDDQGRFTFPGVPPGAYRIHPGPLRQYPVLASAMTGGRDALDFGLSVPPSGVTDLVLTFAAKGTRVDGQVTAPALPGKGPCYIVMYPSDRAYWLPGARRIAATAPASDGRFVFRLLPPGDYTVSAFVGQEPPTWTDPRLLATLLPAAHVTVVRGATVNTSLSCR
jgi:hypothetical protein